MVHVSRVRGDDNVDRLIRGEFGEEVTALTDGSIMLFNPLKCVRCGMCAVKCPTGACMMSVNSFTDCFIESEHGLTFAGPSAGRVTA